MTILNRLITSYLLIVTLVVISSVYTISNISKLDATISATSANARIVRLSEEISDALYAQTASEEKYLISGDPDYYAQFRKISLDFQKKFGELGGIVDDREQKLLAGKTRALHRDYMQLFEKRVSLLMTRPERKTFSSRYRLSKERLLEEIDQNLRKIGRIAASDEREKLRLSQVISVRVVRVITITEIVAVILVIVISFRNTKSINAPLTILRDKTKMIARGEFGRPLSILSPPEVKELADSFDAMCARLQELDRMKIDYISHLSHELRTPLTAIKEASSMLSEGVFSDQADKQKELYGLIEEECGRLINSVNRTLDLCRMESGIEPFYFESANLLPIIEKNVLKLSAIARRKRIEISLALKEELPAISIDKERIGEVVENLLDNALKFTPHGGRVIIDSKHNPHDGNVEVSLSDTGCGIPEEGIQQIFDKFKRVDERKGAVRGTGLGLAIVKHIINAHGGRVWAESKPGEGSVFTFSLPVSG
ncbi:MAG: ATP-binding protein [Pseudomonadota bacterium]